MQISNILALAATLALATSAAIPHAGRDLDAELDTPVDDTTVDVPTVEVPDFFTSHDRQPRPIDPPRKAKRNFNLGFLHFIHEDVARPRPEHAKREASPGLVPFLTGGLVSALTQDSK